MTPGQRCPKCGGNQFLIVDPVRDQDCDAVTSTHELHVLASSTRHTPRTGHYRAEICETCGFIEWYATRLDPGVVAQMLVDPGAGVRRVQS